MTDSRRNDPEQRAIAEALELIAAARALWEQVSAFADRFERFEYVDSAELADELGDDAYRTWLDETGYFYSHHYVHMAEARLAGLTDSLLPPELAAELTGSAAWYADWVANHVAAGYALSRDLDTALAVGEQARERYLEAGDRA